MHVREFVPIRVYIYMYTGVDATNVLNARVDCVLGSLLNCTFFEWTYYNMVPLVFLVFIHALYSRSAWPVCVCIHLPTQFVAN